MAVMAHDIVKNISSITRWTVPLDTLKRLHVKALQSTTITVPELLTSFAFATYPSINPYVYSRNDRGDVLFALGADRRTKVFQVLKSGMLGMAYQEVRSNGVADCRRNVMRKQAVD
jgi:hypothetical protein